VISYDTGQLHETRDTAQNLSFWRLLALHSNTHSQWCMLIFEWRLLTVGLETWIENDRRLDTLASMFGCSDRWLQLFHPHQSLLLAARRHRQWPAATGNCETERCSRRCQFIRLRNLNHPVSSHSCSKAVG